MTRRVTGKFLFVMTDLFLHKAGVVLPGEALLALLTGLTPGGLLVTTGLLAKQLAVIFH